MAIPQPTVGSIVHYVSYGTPNGEYTSQCRAAIVTAVDTYQDGVGGGGLHIGHVSLCVLNPEGQFFNPAVMQDELPPRNKIVPGERAEHLGGTWHWPEGSISAWAGACVKRFTLRVVDVARICHEANRALQIATDDPAPSPHWEEAPQWQRTSALEGVEAAQNGITDEALHEAWCASKRADGWTHGETKDADAKTHPCLVPYAELPIEQRAKDSLFRVIVETLT